MTNELITYKNQEASLDYCLKVANVFMKSGKFSQKEYNVETVAMLVMYAHELGVSPAKALINGFDIIQGKISMKPALMNDMIRRAGHSIEILQWDEEGCTVKGVRKDNGNTLTVKFSKEDAKRAGFDQKDVYKKNPKNMYFARAMGNLGRMLFGDIIGNTYGEDEIFEQEKKAPKFLTKPSTDVQTVEAVVSDVQDAPKTHSTAYTIDDLHKACTDSGVELKKGILTEFVLNLRDQKNAKGGKQVTDFDIVQSAFLPGMMETFVMRLKEYLSQPDPEEIPIE